MTESAERVLLSFTGFHDPFGAAAIEGTEQEGPILSLVRSVPFRRVILFSTPKTKVQTDATQRELRLRHEGVMVELHHLELDDPTDYRQILASLRRSYAGIVDAYPGGEFFVATASGTPQMHACWVLLTASGEIPAKILSARPPRFVSGERALVTEIDFTRPEFPTIRARLGAAIEGTPETVDATELTRRLGILGDHPAFLSALETAAILAQSELGVLLLGESGTGKEKFARLIHAGSSRAGGPFIAVNCAAVPKDLAESYLFGHRRGAFTGALSDMLGRFEAADGGTLFLDEVAELSEDIQAKLLRALQDNVIEPLGARVAKQVSTRIIAATNRDLTVAVAAGRFREDLYYRLQVAELRLPPLRERRSDIAKLALHFLDEINESLRPHRQLTPDALTAIQAYDWPGNVRQLRNSVQRAAVLAKRGEIRSDDLGLKPEGARPQTIVPDPHPGFSVEDYIGSIRTALFERALDIAGGNQSEAARLLGVTPQAVWKYTKAAGNG